MSAMITILYRVIATVGKHVIAQYTLSGGNEHVSINESAQLGIVITGLEVVELGFSIEQLTSDYIDNIS